MSSKMERKIANRIKTHDGIKLTMESNSWWKLQPNELENQPQN